MNLKKYIFLALFFFTITLYALEIPILVKDNDLNIPLEGVTVSMPGAFSSSFITDADGRVTLIIPDEASYPLSIICITPGYADTEITLTKSSVSYTKENPLVIAMGLDTVLEGEELVVEGNTPGKTDEKPGVSIVRTSEEMKTTAQIGIIADVMTSVATLPGVGFKLGMNNDPSIRGGYPAEMGVTLDGVYLVKPYYWNGMVSILSPYLVDTVKLSTGIFSARYGQGTSGLLDTTSVKIDEKKITLNISTISADAAFELPLGEKSELFLYAHATEFIPTKYILFGILDICDELLPDKYDMTIETNRSQLRFFQRAPYLYSIYGKWDFTPLQEFKLSVNALYAIDGMKMYSSSETESTEPEYLELLDLYGYYAPYIGIGKVDYFNTQTLGSLKLNWLITPRITVNSSVSFSYVKEREDTQLYSFSHYVRSDYVKNVFLDAYWQDDLLIKETNDLYQIQGGIWTDIQLKNSNIISLGCEEVFKTTNIQTLKFYRYSTNDTIDNGQLVNKETASSSDSLVPGNNVLNTAAFVVWDFGSDTSLLQGEAGIRGEHYFLWNKEAGLNLNSNPVVNPRVNIIYTPFRHIGVVDAVSFSVGSGLYSALSDAAWEIQKEAVSDTFTLKPDTAWLSVIGTDLRFDAGISISIEGYYKQYLSRTYVYTDERDSRNVMYHAGTDGKGFATGADIMIEKSINDKVDGYITYSFLFARFYNPVTSQYDSQTTTTGDPLGIWYYPSYHRYHTVNMVTNFRLKKESTLTISASFATGTPAKQSTDTDEETPVARIGVPSPSKVLDDSLYSDELRNYIDLPLDIRFSKKGGFKNRKGTWEWYIGVENMFSIPIFFIKQDLARKGGVPYKSSGWTIGEGVMTIDMGFFPIPSFGVKMMF